MLEDVADTAFGEDDILPRRQERLRHFGHWCCTAIQLSKLPCCQIQQGGSLPSLGVES